MEEIIEPTTDYDFTKLYFGPPSTLVGGSYFTRLMYNTNKSLFIQTPKSLTKQGFVKSGKKMYADLMFDNNDTVFINWIENLESRCQELIYSKRESWFETKLEKDDIESAFTSPFKIYKSGKFYLLRVNVKQNIKIYDERDKIISTESITNDKTIISILEIQGLKFTSRNFQIEFELKQSMIVSPDPFLDECFIKKPYKEQNIKTLTTETEINLDNLIDKSVKELVNKHKNNESVLSNTNNMFDLEESNIELEIEDLVSNEEKEDPNVLKEIDFTSTSDNLETIHLKNPKEVYYEIYKKAREKAIDAKKNAIFAYIEMKNIKKTYMLDDIDENDDEFNTLNYDFKSNDIYSEISNTESLEEDI